jgi:hypothetical protein
MGVSLLIGPIVASNMAGGHFFMGYGESLDLHVATCAGCTIGIDHL